jgi:hypothetical protein
MSYQEPAIIEEPKRPRKIYLVAGIITLFTLAIVGGIYYWVQTRPLTAAEEPRLEGALRAGAPEFDQARDRIVVKDLWVNMSTRLLGDVVEEIHARVKNSTERTISGLEMHGLVVDEQGATAGERTIIVIPQRQPSLQPGETMEVRILVEGISRKAKSLTARMEVTGVRFD